MPRSRLSDTERFLHEKIPLSLAMGVQLEGDSQGRVILTAPLQANHNHLGTAFGGSLAAVATLAGYALLWLELDDRDSHIVIRQSTISYRQPVVNEILATCLRPSDKEIKEFKKRFQRKGKASISLTVLIGDLSSPCVEFQGDYVALR
jgi:thioesterase domain-containing protein